MTYLFAALNCLCFGILLWMYLHEVRKNERIYKLLEGCRVMLLEHMQRCFLPKS